MRISSPGSDKFENILNNNNNQNVYLDNTRKEEAARKPTNEIKNTIIETRKSPPSTICNYYEKSSKGNTPNDFVISPSQIKAKNFCNFNYAQTHDKSTIGKEFSGKKIIIDDLEDVDEVVTPVKVIKINNSILKTKTSLDKDKKEKNENKTEQVQKSYNNENTVLNNSNNDLNITIISHNNVLPFQLENLGNKFNLFDNNISASEDSESNIDLEEEKILSNSKKYNNCIIKPNDNELCKKPTTSFNSNNSNMAFSEIKPIERKSLIVSNPDKSVNCSKFKLYSSPEMPHQGDFEVDMHKFDNDSISKNNIIAGVLNDLTPEGNNCKEDNKSKQTKSLLVPSTNDTIDSIKEKNETKTRFKNITDFQIILMKENDKSIILNNNNDKENNKNLINVVNCNTNSKMKEDKYSKRVGSSSSLSFSNLHLFGKSNSNISKLNAPKNSHNIPKPTHKTVKNVVPNNIPRVSKTQFNKSDLKSEGIFKRSNSLCESQLQTSKHNEIRKFSKEKVNTTSKDKDKKLQNKKSKSLRENIKKPDMLINSLTIDNELTQMNIRYNLQDIVKKVSLTKINSQKRLNGEYKTLNTNIEKSKNDRNSSKAKENSRDLVDQIILFERNFQKMKSKAKKKKEIELTQQIHNVTCENNKVIPIPITFSFNK